MVERVENDTEAGGERKWRQCSKTLQEWRQNVQKPFRHLYVPSSGDLLNLVDVFNVLPAMVRANELDLGAAASWWDDMADDASKAARDKFMAVLATRISSMARQGAEKAAPVQGAAEGEGAAGAQGTAPQVCTWSVLSDAAALRADCPPPSVTGAPGARAARRGRA